MKEPPFFVPRPASSRTPLTTALVSWLYFHSRRVAPKRAVLKLLLELARLFRQFAWAQVWYSMSADDALRTCRPQALEFVKRAVAPGMRVIDLGAGAGLFSRAVATVAAEVVCVDVSKESLERARETCRDISNVRFVLGDGLAVLQETGPCDVALLLHCLGYEADPAAALRSLRAFAKRIVVEVPDFDSDPLNRLRLRLGLPCFSDAGYRVEFGHAGLLACLDASGWHVRETLAHAGTILAVADR